MSTKIETDTTQPEVIQLEAGKVYMYDGIPMRLHEDEGELSLRELPKEQRETAQEPEAVEYDIWGRKFRDQERRYWFPSDCFYKEANFDSEEVDQFRRQLGLVFHTEEEAEHMIRYLKGRALLLEQKRILNPVTFAAFKCPQAVFFDLGWDSEFGRVRPMGHGTGWPTSEIHFRSIDDARAALQNITDALGDEGLDCVKAYLGKRS